MSFRDFLKKIHVIQIVNNENRGVRLGKGYFDAHRINPFNPLSYIIVLIGFVVGLICFGFIGIWSQTDGNPFKWN